MAKRSVNGAVRGHSRLRALIADDQSSVRNGISRVLDDDDSIEIVSECANHNEAIAALAEHAPDMLFVDVQLLEVRGCQVVAASGGIPAVLPARSIVTRRAHSMPMPPISSSKPSNSKRLPQAEECAKFRVQTERGRVGESTPESVSREPQQQNVASQASKYLERLALRNGKRHFFQKVRLVDSFTAASNYVHVHCGLQTHRLRSTMKELERKLDPKRFIRIHRRTIVNIECVLEFRPRPRRDYVVTLLDGKELIMSRNPKYRQQFLQALERLNYTQ